VEILPEKRPHPGIITEKEEKTAAIKKGASINSIRGGERGNRGGRRAYSG